MNQLFYKNIKGEYSPLPEGIPGQIRVNGRWAGWVNIDDYVRFKEFVFLQQKELSRELNINPEFQSSEYEVLDAFTQLYKPKLITEQFLISKGYKKTGMGKVFLKRGPQEQDVHINFDTWHPEAPTVTICGDDNPYDYTWYNGPIPTESQYEVLKELLKLHE